MTKDRDPSLIRRGVDTVLEGSTTIDKIVMPPSGILYLAGYPPAGVVFVISAVTYLAADMAQKPTE